MICPDWQYPHWGTCSAIHACCSGCERSDDKPSMVVIFAFEAAETGVRQERAGLPSMWTVQAPQRPAPHPNFVPVSSSVSRSTQSNGVSAATLIFRSWPLMRRVNSGMHFFLSERTVKDYASHFVAASAIAGRFSQTEARAASSTSKPSCNSSLPMVSGISRRITLP
jgi:hypothetical protein